MTGDNPYQPTFSLPQEEPQSGEVLRALRPGKSFIKVAFMALIVPIVLTVITYGSAWWTFPILALGILRAYLVHRRRSFRQLRELNAIRLLVSSTLLTLAMLISCSVAFLAICITGAKAMGSHEERLIVWVCLNVAVAIAAFVFMYIKSIGWGSSVS